MKALPGRRWINFISIDYNRKSSFSPTLQKKKKFGLIKGREKKSLIFCPGFLFFSAVRPFTVCCMQRSMKVIIFSLSFFKSMLCSPGPGPNSFFLKYKVKGQIFFSPRQTVITKGLFSAEEKFTDWTLHLEL